MIRSSHLSALGPTTSYREKLSSFTAVSHLTVEIVRSADAKAASAPIRAYICGRMAEVLAISRYDKLFAVYADVESALAEYGGRVVRRIG